MAKQITWKLKAGVTWREKLESRHPNHGKQIPVPPPMQKCFGRGMMLIPRPLDVDAVMRTPKKGRLITAAQVREQLARMVGADCTCPLTSGMFMRIVAEAAEEDLRNGRKRVTPYWRTIKDDGKLNDKFPGGVRAQAARLREEGFEVRPSKGKQPPSVQDYESHLVKLPAK